MSESRFVCLEFEGDFEMLVPQAELTSLESVLDARPEVPQAGAVGTLPIAGVSVPVFSPDASLALMDSLPDSRRMCAVLRSTDAHLAIACAGMRPVTVENSRLFALPPSMHVEPTPWSGLAVVDSEVLPRASATQLKRLFVSDEMASQQGVEDHPA